MNERKLLASLLLAIPEGWRPLDGCTPQVLGFRLWWYSHPHEAFTGYIQQINVFTYGHTIDLTIIRQGHNKHEEARFENTESGRAELISRIADATGWAR